MDAQENLDVEAELQDSIAYNQLRSAVHLSQKMLLLMLKYRLRLQHERNM